MLQLPSIAVSRQYCSVRLSNLKAILEWCITPISKQLCPVGIFQSQTSGTIAASIYGSLKATSQRLAAPASRQYCSFQLLQSQGNIAVSGYFYFKAISQLPSVAISKRYCSLHPLHSQGNIAATIYCSLKAMLQCLVTSASGQYCSVHLLQPQSTIAASIHWNHRQCYSFHLLHSQGNIAVTIYSSLKRPSTPVSSDQHLQSQASIHCTLKCLAISASSAYLLKPQASLCCNLKALLQFPSILLPRQYCSFHLLQSRSFHLLVKLWWCTIFSSILISLQVDVLVSSGIWHLHWFLESRGRTYEFNAFNFHVFGVLLSRASFLNTWIFLSFWVCSNSTDQLQASLKA